MKTTVIKHSALNIFGVAAILAAATSCSDGKGLHWGVVEPDHGTVSFRAMSVNVDTDAPTEGRAVDNSIDVSDYIVELLRADNTTVGSWSFSKMPEIQILPVGEYKVNVMSHAVKPAAFSEPLYAGSSAFAIAEGEVHNVGTVLCTMSNIKVTVNFSDLLVSMADASSVVTVESGNSSLNFGLDEDRAGYFQHIEGSSVLVATFKGKIAGRTEEFRKVITDVKPGHHYILNYTVKGGGFITPAAVTLDATVDGAEVNFAVDPDDELLDDSDRPSGGHVDPPVSDDAITFTSSMLNFTTPNSTAVEEAVVLIHADNGIASLVVDIISEQLTDEMLTDVGLAAHFDLAAPAHLEGALLDLGFPVGDDVVGKTDIRFDITQFMPLLEIYSGTHQFRITVTDSVGKSDNRTLTFKVD